MGERQERPKGSTPQRCGVGSTPLGLSMQLAEAPSGFGSAPPIRWWVRYGGGVPGRVGLGIGRWQAGDAAVGA